MHLLTENLVQDLLAIEDFEGQKQFVAENATLFDDEHLKELKAVADHYLRADLERSRRFADLLFHLANSSGSEIPRALGLLMQANACAVGGLGEYAQAVKLYEQAAEIYAAYERPADQAKSQIGKVFALTHLGQHQKAEETAKWAHDVLERHEEWLPLARLVSNWGISLSRQGNDAQSLVMFDKAREYCLKSNDSKDDPFLPNTEHNRSIALRDLGRFDESIEACQKARKLLLEMERPVEAARALQSLATTYYIQGRYNEALTYLGQVGREFMDDGRYRDAMRVELHMSNCMLQLRRFGDVLDKCREVRRLFSEKGVQYEVAQAILFEATAYTGLKRYDEAWVALDEARSLFAAVGNDVGIALIDLQKASVLYLRQRHDESARLAHNSANVFAKHKKPVDEALARLAMARALIALNQLDSAYSQIDQVWAEYADQALPSVHYQCHHLLGAIESIRGDTALALAQFDRAIEALEHLRGSLMLEYRASFLEDKQTVYEDAVLLCLDADRPEDAFFYTEKAKSRALIDLLAHRLNLRVRVRAPEDQPLLDELVRLRSDRDRMYRQWEGNDEVRSSSPATRGAQFADKEQALVNIEKRITELWHTLLIRNADYAGDAALWRSRIEPVQPYLTEDLALLEYFVAKDQIIVFVVTRDCIVAQRLAANSRQIQQLLRLLNLNLAAVPTLNQTQQLVDLTANAQGILTRLYEALVAPVGELLAPYRHLIIVPHGPLHYLPFHALYTEGQYLLEEFEISYLPSASYLHYCQGSGIGDRKLIAFGNSNNQLLPHAVREAQAIAQLMGGRLFVESESTKEQLKHCAGEAGILHLATHADFRADNPLFSGLYLEDGWLTTQDVFELELSASLVTLSACQTGRSVVGGGDELLGLMRAFISAGASSLVLSHWPVEDSSTAHLMQHFYGRLATGWGKSAALRDAQCAFLSAEQNINNDNLSRFTYAHPYFWAPFYLVGDTGTLHGERSRSP